MTYLIDTNIIIFALKDPQRTVAQRLAATPANEIVLASVVEAELYYGAEKFTLSEQRQELLTDFLALYHRLPFDSRCVPHTPKSDIIWKYAAKSSAGMTC